MKFLPRQNGPYYLVIELHNLRTGKIRLVSLKGKAEMEKVVAKRKGVENRLMKILILRLVT